MYEPNTSEVTNELNKFPRPPGGYIYWHQNSLFIYCNTSVDDVRGSLRAYLRDKSY